MRARTQCSDTGPEDLALEGAGASSNDEIFAVAGVTFRKHVVGNCKSRTAGDPRAPQQDVSDDLKPLVEEAMQTIPLGNS